MSGDADVESRNSARSLKVMFPSHGAVRQYERFRHAARVVRPTTALLTAALLVGACSSSQSTSTANSPTVSSTPGTAVPTTASISPLANRYLQILGPADAAAGKFFAALKALPTTATGATAEKIASPTADAIQIADRQLLKMTWPGRVELDIHALVTADELLVRDLRDVGSQTMLTSGPWKTTFVNDVNAVSKYANVVHTDLQAATPTK